MCMKNEMGGAVGGVITRTSVPTTWDHEAVLFSLIEEIVKKFLDQLKESSVSWRVFKCKEFKKCKLVKKK